MIKDEVLNSFKGKNCLVTGGTGLIGRQVVKMLCDAGAEVVTVSLDKTMPTEDKRPEYAYGDLTDFDICESLTKDMDYVFHIAGVKGSAEVTRTKPASFFVPLLQMNTNILEACRINKVQKVIYVSSIGAYENARILKETNSQDGPPMDAFPGWAKRMGEMQVQAYKIQYGLDNFYIVRPSNVYGPGDNFDTDNAMVIPSLLAKIERGDNPVQIKGDGSATRDFVFSRDVAEGIILAMYHGIYVIPFLNLGGKVFSILQLVETLSQFIGFNCQFDMKPSGYPRRIMDSSLAKKLIDYNPTTSLFDGLVETWNWYNANKEEHLKKKNYFKEGK